MAIFIRDFVGPRVIDLDEVVPGRKYMQIANREIFISVMDNCKRADAEDLCGRTYETWVRGTDI